MYFLIDIIYYIINWQHLNTSNFIYSYYPYIDCLLPRLGDHEDWERLKGDVRENWDNELLVLLNLLFPYYEDEIWVDLISTPVNFCSFYCTFNITFSIIISLIFYSISNYLVFFYKITFEVNKFCTLNPIIPFDKLKLNDKLLSNFK